jgi:hypothetical protein
MSAITSNITRFFDELPISSGMTWFVRGVYAWLALNTLSLWSSYDLIWGSDSVFQRMGHIDGVLNNLVYHLVYTKRWAYLVFHAHWVGALLSMGSYRGVFVVRIGVWITGLMLFYSAIEVFNSGMMVMNIMAFYLIFYNATRHAQWLNKGIYMMCAAQVIIIYGVSAMFKLRGEQWLEGDILYFVMQTPHFVSAWIRDSALISCNTLLTTLGYLALAYQLLFPLLVFWKRGAWYFIIFGVLFHLFIAFFMHLYDFGFAMIVCYALFIPSKSK